MPRAPLLGGAKKGKRKKKGKKKGKKERKKEEKKERKKITIPTHTGVNVNESRTISHILPKIIFICVFNAIKSIIKRFIHTIKHIKLSNILRALRA